MLKDIIILFVSQSRSHAIIPKDKDVILFPSFLRHGVEPNLSESNRIIMGNSDHTCAQIQVAWTAVSDCRDKHIYCHLDRDWETN